jgi:hypothetical protein
MKTIAAVGRQMIGILHGRKHVEDPRFRDGLLSWLIVQDGWITPVWTHLTRYSGEGDVVRFRNDMVTKLPKSQWDHRKPDLFRFEMTAMIEECSDRLLIVVIDYCELARRQPKSGFDRHPAEFPDGSDHGGYGWTQLAWDTMTKRFRDRR